jgi:outer membrane protein OmpA-like peptidoglycan-associated protein
MIQSHISKQKISFLLLVLIFVGVSGIAQDVKRTEPKWWFGLSGAANFNTYQGTTQMLNEIITVPTAFHKGKGVKPYASVLTEYRPNKTVGFMLNVAYDNRGGKFEEVIAPCNCPADLTTQLSYVSVEPSFRLAPFSNAFYLFIGPTFDFNVGKTFSYDQNKQYYIKGDWSNLRSTVISAQAGAGIDIPISKRKSETQMTLSPFASFQTNMFQSPRTVESWSIYTVRAGIALKFGTGKVKALPIVETPATVVPVVTPIVIVEKEVQFSVRAPKFVPANRQIKESFPIRNSIFFNTGSVEIPSRYVLLNASAAASFKEEQLQEDQPNNLSTGRSARQMAVYYNILNITGSRMRANPSTSIVLTGSSDNHPEEGKQMAENVKLYLVTNYSVDPSRITTEGRDKPIMPSELPGATRELTLLREGDRRVDITSGSEGIMMQVGGTLTNYMRPVEIRAYQKDPLDSHVIFTADGASKNYKTWSVELTDEKSVVQNYGPFTGDQATVPGKTILGNNPQGNYKIVMTAETNAGVIVKKESYVSLIKTDDPKQEGLRYSILFDFDKSKTIESYENFLVQVVCPLVPDNGTVIIHGHTDEIGESAYNLNLSKERANGAQKIMENALQKAGKKGVRFETYGFGEDPGMSPFENNYPEERFYNRTVIIDIIPNK